MSLLKRLINAFRGSLRAKITLGALVPLVCILSVITAIENARHQAAVFTTQSFLASRIGQVIENSLQSAMRDRNQVELQQVLNAVGQDETLRHVYLLDPQGRIAFAPAGQNVGARLDNRDAACQPCHALPPAQRPQSVVVTLPDGERVFRSMTPIENRPACHGCHAADQRLNGVLLTDISMAPVEAALAADLREHIFWWGTSILATVAVVNLALSQLVLRRLRAIAQAMARFGAGQLDQRVPAGSSDELGQLADAFNEMGRRLQADKAEKQSLAQDVQREAAQRRALLKQLISSQEEERRRVARDLHDDLGQDLSGLALNLEAIERLAAKQPEQARQQLRQLRAHIAEMTNRAYDLILSLRPSALDDLGLGPALRAQAERTLKGTAIRFTLETERLPGRLPPELETAAFRTLQEALTNVVRHSGASQVRLTLAVRGGVFEAEITDDGCGFDPASVRVNGHGPRGLGLLGMQERMAQCGGALEIISQAGAGTCLRLRLPLPEAVYA